MNALFTSRDEIITLIQRADNREETKRITSNLQTLKTVRQPFYLEEKELQDILEWKLRSQIGRQLKRRGLNTNQNIIIITKAAFSVSHDNEDLEISLRLKLLTSLNGVAVPVASAILTLCFPSHYSVIDYRNWRQIYGALPSKTTPTIQEYIDYLKIIKGMAANFEVTTQEVDIAIWQKDKESGR